MVVLQREWIGIGEGGVLSPRNGPVRVATSALVVDLDLQQDVQIIDRFAM